MTNDDLPTSEAEAEVQRIKVSVIKTEEERIMMEKRVGETELIVHRCRSPASSICCYPVLTLNFCSCYFSLLPLVCPSSTTLRMVEEAERRQQEAERLRLEVAQAR